MHSVTIRLHIAAKTDWAQSSLITRIQTAVYFTIASRNSRCHLLPQRHECWEAALATCVESRIPKTYVLKISQKIFHMVEIRITYLLLQPPLQPTSFVL